jgi:hypothetical protein
MQRYIAFAAVLLAVLALHPDKTFGQATDGNIVGTVLDASGASVPNATLELDNVATGARFNTSSDQNGLYRFNNVPVGTYAITAASGGFTKARLERVNVELNKTTTANFTLQVGGVTEQVTVTEAAALIDTTTAQVQSTYTTRQAIDLPVTAHFLGPLNLSLLSAGVATSGGVGVGEGPSVGGQRPRNNSFTIEGVDNNRKDVTGSNVRVPNEAVGEFTMLQNQFSAEFGHAGGGQFNTIVKSGTNEFHGTAFLYNQNRNYNAVDQSNKRQGLFDNPRFDDNRYGGNIGGPIIKNKLLAFGHYEYNPVGFAGSPSDPISAPTAEGYSRLASIPGASTTNLQVLQQYLSPASAATDVVSVGGVQIPIGVVPITYPSYQNNQYWLMSVDYNLAASDQVKFRYIDNESLGIDPSTQPKLAAFSQPRTTTGKMAMLSEFHTFSPTVLNELRLGYNRYNDTIPAGDYAFPGLDRFPNIEVADLNVQVGPFTDAPQSGIINTYQIANNLNWTAGSHAWKFGVDARKYIAPTNFIQRERGDYQYSTLERYILDLPPDELAQRNLGGAPYAGNSANFYWFANDTWRVRQNLSLNLGLRYEYKGIPRGDKLQVLNASSSRTGLIEFREPAVEKMNFAPRIGIAYSPGTNGLTSIRAGFGMSYDNYFDNLGTNSKPPQLESTLDDPVVGSNTPGYLRNGGIAPSRRPAALTAEDALAATSAYIPDQNLPYSLQWNVGVQRVFAQDYTAEVRYLGTRGVNLFTQNRLNAFAPVNATRSLPLYYQQPAQAELNALPLTLAQLTAEGPFKPEWAAAGFNQQFITAFDNRGNSIYHGLAAELTRRFSAGLLFKAAYTWSKLIDDSTADLNSTSLAPRRPQDFNDMRNERARSFLDRTHRFTFSAVWDLQPFRNSNWLTRNLIGNWMLAPIYTYESPQYATVQSAQDSNLDGDTAGDRALVNLQGDMSRGSDVTALTNAAGDTVAYVVNDPGAGYIRARPGLFPNAGRSTIPMDNINNVDLNISKKFAIGESRAFEVRALFFNLLNHAQFTPGYVSNVYARSSTQTRNHLTPGLPIFGDYTQVFDSNSRTMQLVARFTF